MLDRAKLLAALDRYPFAERCAALSPRDFQTAGLCEWLEDPKLHSLEDLIARDAAPELHLAAAFLIQDTLNPARDNRREFTGQRRHPRIRK